MTGHILRLERILSVRKSVRKPRTVIKSLRQGKRKRKLKKSKPRPTARGKKLAPNVGQRSTCGRKFATVATRLQLLHSLLALQQKYFYFGQQQQIGEMPLGDRRHRPRKKTGL